MFTSLLFGGLSRPLGEGNDDDGSPRPSSAPSGARLSAMMAVRDAEVANRAPILRPSTAADNKPMLNTSDSVMSVDSKTAKSPLPDTRAALADENRAPTTLTPDRSTDEVFHTPIVTAGSETSFKFADTSISSLSQSVRVKAKAPESSDAEQPSIQIRRGLIEPLGVPIPATYADATNLATQYPKVADDILALPLSPNKPNGKAHRDELGNSTENVDLPTSGSTPFVVADARIKAPSKMLKDTHTTSKPNWALAPDPSPKNSPNRKGGRRPRSGKNKESSKESEVRERQSRRNGRPRNEAATQDAISSSIDKSMTMVDAPTSRKGRQRRAQSYTSARDNRIDRPSRKTKTPEDNFPAEQDTRSALHLAQVDALIRELQKTRGLLDTPGTSNGMSSQKGTPVRTCSVSPVASLSASEPHGQLVWSAGQDGVLRPDLGGRSKTSEIRQPSSSTPSSPPAFLPAGMQILYPQPMQRNMKLHTVSAPGSSSRSGNRPTRRQLEPQAPRDFGSAFPTAFHGSSSRIPDTKGAAGNKIGRSRSRNPNNHTTMRSSQDEILSWRSSKLHKDPAPSPVRSSSPSGGALGQVQHWPTLDEICAVKASSSTT